MTHPRPINIVIANAYIRAFAIAAVFCALLVLILGVGALVDAYHTSPEPLPCWADTTCGDEDDC